MLRLILRTAMVILVAAAMLLTNINGAPTQFTAQVYLKKNGKIVENLTAKDFRLFENQREQTISKVERETQPLSIVLIPMLGQGRYCDTAFFIIPKPAPSNDMSLVADAFQKYLVRDDEFAMILPDESASVLREFDEPNNLINDFDELRKISNASQRTISEETTNYGSMGMDNQTSTESYLGVNTNFAENAVVKSLDYLQTQTKDGNRQVIFFLRPFYNLSETGSETETQIKQKIARQGTLFNWIGDDKEVYPFAPYKFFRNLPDVTGSEKQPCKLLKSNDANKIGAVVSGMLTRLRTRYRITYESNNLPEIGNLRQTELQITNEGRKKAKGQAEITAPQFVYVK